MSTGKDGSPNPKAQAGWNAGKGYRCPRCGFVVYVADGQKPPAYCRNCAIVHLKSELVPIDQPR